MFGHRKQSCSYNSTDSTRCMPQVRQGDWVCVSCSNLNFAFRTICNRCKVQTKETNFSYYYTFIVTPPQFDPAYSLNALPLPTEHLSASTFEQNKENCKAFQSALLLTPTKNHDNAEIDAPYKSPCSLPSVSPLLKKYNSSQLVKYSTRSKISCSSTENLQIGKFELEKTTRDESEGEDEEMDMQINKLLSEIEFDV